MYADFVNLRRPLQNASAALITVLCLSGCINVTFQSPGITTTPTPLQTESFDDSGALKFLGTVVQTLYSYVGEHDQVWCMGVSLLASQAKDSTPAPSYQGKYEIISQNLAVIANSCSIDPGDKFAISTAIQTKADAIKILDDRKYLGGDWDNF